MEAVDFKKAKLALAKSFAASMNEKVKTLHQNGSLVACDTKSFIKFAQVMVEEATALGQKFPEPPEA